MTGCVLRPAGAFPGCRLGAFCPCRSGFPGVSARTKACAGFGMIRLAGSFSPAGSTRRVLLRSLPRPPTAVFPPDGPCLHPNGGGAVHALAAALRRRRAPGKGRWRGLARVSARMPPYPLPARAREMHVRVQRRVKKRGAGRWPAPLAARAGCFPRRLSRVGTAVHWLCRPPRQPSGWLGAGAGAGKACWRTARDAGPCGSASLPNGPLRISHPIGAPAYASLPRSTGCPAPMFRRGQRASPRR